MRSGAGQLRHRVAVEVRSEVLDGYGDTITTWTEVATRWAFVKPVRGAESEAAMQTRAVVYYTVRMRGAASDITPKRHRLIWSGRTLEVTANLDATGKGGDRLLYVEERV